MVSRSPTFLPALVSCNTISMNQETNYENVVRCGTICEIWELREMWDVYEPRRHANLARKMPQMGVKFSKFSGVEPPDSPVSMTEISEVLKI